jgi:hypothetical protein
LPALRQQFRVSFARLLRQKLPDARHIDKALTFDAAFSAQNNRADVATFDQHVRKRATDSEKCFQSAQIAKFGGVRAR